MPNFSQAPRHPRLRVSLWHCAALLCVVVFLFAATMLIRDLSRAQREQDANRLLAQQVQQRREMFSSMASSDPSAEKAPARAENGMLEQYAPLWEENHDLAGWLSIPDTQIDYPVMHTPEAPEYYLRRGFDKKYAMSGSLFIGDGCAPDSLHTIVYGHAMKNGSMFGSLKRYADPGFWAEHPVIQYDTLMQEGEYEVIAAFYSRVYTDRDTGVFRYYQYTDLSERETFDDYVSQATRSALYDTGLSAAYGDHLLTLSTCSYHTENGRFVVVARQASK